MSEFAYIAHACLCCFRRYIWSFQNYYTRTIVTSTKLVLLPLAQYANPSFPTLLIEPIIIALGRIVMMEWKSESRFSGISNDYFYLCFSVSSKSWPLSSLSKPNEVCMTRKVDNQDARKPRPTKWECNNDQASRYKFSKQVPGYNVCTSHFHCPISLVQILLVMFKWNF